MELDFRKNLYVIQALQELSPGIEVATWEHTWESVTLKDESPVGMPSKDRFDRRFQELINSFPLQRLREERNIRLRRTDFLTVPDFPYPSEEIKQAWLNYRTILRNITATTTPSLDEDGNLVVTWPTPPIWPANVV
tara:strand:- start:24 stop:431 length:408 start_codon:yes stop_codon:yes gene_type:complete